MSKKQIIYLVTGIVCLAIGFIAGYKGYSLYVDYKKPAFTKDRVELFIYPDSGIEDVISKLGPHAVNFRSLMRMLEKEDVATNLKAGHYLFSKNNPAVYVARALTRGWQSPVNLVLSGSLRVKSQIAAKIASQMMVDSATVAAAFEDKALLAEYGKTPEQIFSMFIPDTYEMYWTASVKDILDKQKQALDAFWTEDNIAKAKAQGLTPMEATIVASIVKGESNYEPEFPKIAGVYLNRLHKGMKLQADPTVAFCYNYTLNRILLKHLEVDSPYNTYKYFGLPPAPICVPTKACLEAVLNPDKAPNLYFCANSDFSGSHKFAVDYSEHLRNAREFQQALNKRQREQGK